MDPALNVFLQLDFEDEPDEDEEKDESSAEEEGSESDGDEAFEDAMENLKISEAGADSEVVAATA